MGSGEPSHLLTQLVLTVFSEERKHQSGNIQNPRSVGIILVATIHGYGAAWLAIWMLFHPYRAVKLFGLTIWPQGMIPRHRARLAQSIGNAVGNELVSQDTVFDALFETGFFQRKVEGFIASYTHEMLSTQYPSLLD